MSNIYDDINPLNYEARYQKIPREIYLRHHWFPIISNLIIKYCKEKKVLDLGCGYGQYIAVIKEGAEKVIGVDVSKRWIDAAKQSYPDVEFILGEAEDIKLNKGFDVIVCIGLLEYVDRIKIFNEINRLLRDDGIILISVPNKYSFFRITSGVYHKIFNKKKHTNEPSRKEMERLLNENGFTIVEFIMNDGLIFLPNFLDKIIGIRVYKLIEKLFVIFKSNPFSNNMIFVAKKNI